LGHRPTGNADGPGVVDQGRGNRRSRRAGDLAAKQLQFGESAKDQICWKIVPVIRQLGRGKCFEPADIRPADRGTERIALLNCQKRRQNRLGQVKCLACPDLDRIGCEQCRLPDDPVAEHIVDDVGFPGRQRQGSEAGVIEKIERHEGAAAVAAAELEIGCYQREFAAPLEAERPDFAIHRDCRIDLVRDEARLVIQVARNLKARQIATEQAGIGQGDLRFRAKLLEIARFVDQTDVATLAVQGERALGRDIAATGDVEQAARFQANAPAQVDRAEALVLEDLVDRDVWRRRQRDRPTRRVAGSAVQPVGDERVVDPATARRQGRTIVDDDVEHPFRKFARREPIRRQVVARIEQIAEQDAIGPRRDRSRRRGHRPVDGDGPARFQVDRATGGDGEVGTGLDTDLTRRLQRHRAERRGIELARSECDRAGRGRRHRRADDDVRTGDRLDPQRTRRSQLIVRCLKLAQVAGDLRSGRCRLARGNLALSGDRVTMQRPVKRSCGRPDGQRSRVASFDIALLEARAGQH